MNNMKNWTPTACVNNLVASIEARANFDRAAYWDNQITKWTERLRVSIAANTLTQGELKALFDAASHLSDDFSDYYSFMGKKRCERHTENYSNAMSKLRNLLKQ